MATVLKCWPIAPAFGNTNGSRPLTYTATWIVETDVMVDFSTALLLGQRATGSFQGQPFDRIPFRGRPYRWINGDGTRFSDTSAIALDFRSVGEVLNDGRVHRINVTWRAPTPGADEEPWRVNSPPLKRRPYYWIEYYTQSEEMFEARNDVSIGPQGSPGVVPPNLFRKRNTAGPLTTAAGEEVEIATDERLHMVFCMMRNVEGPYVGAVINALYEGRINRNIWVLPPEFVTTQVSAASLFQRRSRNIGVRVNQARFLRAEVSQFPEYWEGEQYHQMIVRVRVDSRPFFKFVPNRGVLKYTPGTPGFVEINRDNNNNVQKTNLNQDGTVAVRNVPFMIPYKIAGERSFDRNLGFV